MTHFSRRSFILGAGVCASQLLPYMASPACAKIVRALDKTAALSTKSSPEPLQSTFADSKQLVRTLSFYNTHTGESLKNITFFEKDYIPQALTEINHLFRDHRTNTVHPIDSNLLNLLYYLHTNLETNTPFHLISGFRSLQTNAMLRRRSKGVAKHSQHTLGKAADIALPKSRSPQAIKKAARALGLGGVGAYDHFVHVDTGRVRYWGR